MKRPSPPLISKRTLLGTAILGGLISLFLGVSSSPALEVGQTAPDFQLKGTTGKPVALRDYRGKKNVVVQFYVLDFTPG